MRIVRSILTQDLMPTTSIVLVSRIPKAKQKMTVDCPNCEIYFGTKSRTEAEAKLASYRARKRHDGVPNGEDA
ncbi:unnamed protein product [Trichobilharzia regenti]|nr:unnamed protein product [Trichobilharzia regenti]